MELSGSEIVAVSVTFSPGLAVSSERTQVMSPSIVSSSITIAPFTRLILSVISSPFVSLTNTSDHSTGYVPAAVPAGTVYVSSTITESSAAFTPLPMSSLNPNSGVAGLISI